MRAGCRRCGGRYRTPRSTAATSAGRASSPRRPVQRCDGFSRRAAAAPWGSVGAAGGGSVSGPRLVTEATRAEMRRILTEVRDGSFAQRWIDEYDSGSPNFIAMREAERQRQIEQTGAALRPMMSWID